MAIEDYDPQFYRTFQKTTRPAFDLMVDLSVENAHLVPNEGPGIVVCNHKSDMDPFLILSNVKRPIHWFAGSYLYNIPVWGGIMKKLGAIPVSKDKDEIKAAFEEAMEYLNRGELVGVFPEGWEYISEGKFTAPIGRFQTGFVRLALNSGAPIIPMAMVGIRAHTEPQALPPSIRKLLNFPFELQYNPSRLQFEKAHIIVGRPLYIPAPEGKPSHEYLTEWAETARSAVVALESRIVSRRLITTKGEQGKEQWETNPLDARLNYYLDRLAENPGELRGHLEYQAGPAAFDAMRHLAERLAFNRTDDDDPGELLHAAMTLGWLARMEVEQEMPRIPVAEPGTRPERADLLKLLTRLIQPIPDVEEEETLLEPDEVREQDEEL